MSNSALDFWNHPQWLGDSRDNPRDPGFEPFWMRDPQPKQRLSSANGGSGTVQHGIYVPNRPMGTEPLTMSEVGLMMAERQARSMQAEELKTIAMMVEGPNPPPAKAMGIINPVTGIVTMDDGSTMSIGEYRQHLALSAIKG